MKNQINIFPRATEKAYAQSKNNVYIFDAPTGANKQEIAAAVETQYGVKVVNIKTLVQTGKAVRVAKGKRAQKTILRQDTKKAYVTLAEGNKIGIFEEEAPVAEAKTTVKSEKTEKVAKAEKGKK